MRGLVVLAGITLVVGLSAVVGIQSRMPRRAKQPQTLSSPKPALPTASPTTSMPIPTAQRPLHPTPSAPQQFNRQPGFPAPMVELGPEEIPAPGTSMARNPVPVTPSAGAEGTLLLTNLTPGRMYVTLTGGGTETRIALDARVSQEVKLPAGAYQALVRSLDPRVTPYRFEQVVQPGVRQNLPLVVQSVQETAKRSSPQGQVDAAGSDAAVSDAAQQGPAGLSPKSP